MRSIERRPGLGRVRAIAVLAGLAAAPLAAQPLDSAFSYQGRLQDAGAPANGPYDFRFVLFDALVGGSQVGPIVTREDVAVATGLFTVSIDFGPSAFEGGKRWMEVAVRAGASTGPYTPLSERQELQAAPHAGFSLRSTWAGLGGKPAGFADDVDNDTTYSAGTALDLTGTVFSLADLGVTTVKLADGAVTSAKIANGTVTLADLGQNGCSANQLLKWNGTAWTCALDNDTNSGGTVTSVNTGAGLTGGPISGSGTVAVAAAGINSGMLANGAVTTAKIANGAVGVSQINTAEVQARIATTCPTGQYLRGIAANGTALCEPFFAPNVITTLDDPANAVGEYSSIAIASGGLPVISYWDATAGDLKLAFCGNSACSSGTRLTVPVSSGVVGEHTSVAIGADGFVIISYFDNTAGNLGVFHCNNAGCSLSTTTTVDNSPNAVGLFTSIAIGTDGLPVISYVDDTAADLKVVHCGNAACNSGNVITAIDSPTSVRLNTSIAIGEDGLPVISYYDFGTGNLKVAHCGNVTCSAGNTLMTVDASPNDVGFESSIGIGGDGFPVISYYDETVADLKVAHCGNAACTSGNSVTVVDPGGIVGRYTSLAVGTDGLPVISYQDLLGNALKVAHCGNATCTAGTSLVVVDDPGAIVGSHTSIAIGADGLPIISYLNTATASLKVAKCAMRTCQ